MRKDRMVPMMLLVIVLVGVLTLPQGFAKVTKNYYGNKQTPLPSWTHAYTMRLKHSYQTKTYAPESGNGLPIQGSGLPSNHLLERGM